MFWIKATTRFIGARRRPDELVREVETELRIHIEMRTRANVEQGMSPDDARRAALQSFGDFERVRDNCCEIRRSLPFDSTPLRMALHITIAVLTYLFVIVRRARSKRPDMSDAPSAKITAYDEHGRTPVERVFKS